LDAFEPSWLALSALSYTFLFVPRLAGHLLQGGLAEKLQAWLAELCRVYDWDLQFVRIQAQCFEWTVKARPEVAPRDVMLIFRQRTSNLVFANFPELRYQSATDDFWADGCLVISGTGPLPQSLCLDYIRAVREHRLGSGRAP
jgi:REP element-mobilizing transposase RayT